MTEDPIQEEIGEIPPFLDRRKKVSDETKTEPAHSPLGPSAAHRWMNCAGSNALIAKHGLGGETSFEAAEGTAAHTVAARCLKENLDAWELAGEKIAVDDWPDEFEVDEEMVEGVQLYLDTVRADVFTQDAENGGGERWLVEERVGLGEEDPELWGTADSAAVVGPLLRVHDFKYGKGLQVGPEENEQLMCYAAYVISTLSDEFVFDAVELVIVQPRGWHHTGPVRRWVTSVDRLGEWVGAVLLPAAKRTREKNAPLKVGSWCRYCPAKLECDARKKDFLDAVAAAEGARPELMDDFELGALSEQLVGLRSFDKAVHAEIDRRVMKGAYVPGWKLVAKKANRIWAEGAEEAVKEKYGDLAYSEPSLLGPASVEKFPGGKALVAKWAHKPSGGVSVAPESDSREALTPRNAKDVFADILKEG